MTNSVLTDYVCTVKLGYNEHAWDRLILFVIAVIRYYREDLCTKVAIWDQKFQRYSREFFITVIVITEFDCISFMQTNIGKKAEHRMLVKLSQAKQVSRFPLFCMKIIHDFF